MTTATNQMTTCANCTRPFAAARVECPHCGFPVAPVIPTLQSCSACGHQVSAQARACPSCGHPMARERPNHRGLAVPVLAALLCLVIACGGWGVWKHLRRPLVGVWQQSQSFYAADGPGTIKSTYTFDPDGKGHLGMDANANWMQFSWTQEGDDHVVISFQPGPTAEWSNWIERCAYTISDDGKLLTLHPDKSLPTAGTFQRVN